MSRGTFRVNDFTAWSKALTVTADGDAVISHAGAAALRLTADRTGLTTALSRALRRDGFTPGHDRGRVLADTAVMMADGGNTVRGIDVLRHQRDLLGEVASPATLSRALGEVDQQALDRIDAARAQVRAQVWDLIVARHGRIPPARVPTGDLGTQIVLRIDAHFIDVYSRKEQAGRLRGRYGLHPMAVMCDNTDECLADQLRAGTAGANDASDHIALLARAIAQIPEPWRHNLLITADGAGATHQLLNWLTSVDGDDRRRRPARHPRHPGRRLRAGHRRRGRRDHPPTAAPAALATRAAGVRPAGQTTTRHHPQAAARHRTTGVGPADPRRRVALRSVRHQRRTHPARRASARGHRLAGWPPPGPRPRRRSFPGGQRHRRRPATLPTLRGQRRLAAHPRHRLRPDRLAAPARLRRCPGPHRTGHPAVQHLPRPGHPHPRRPQAPAQLPTPIPLVRPHPGHLHAPARAPHPDLNPAPPVGPTPPPRPENGAHRGDTRHYRHAPHPKTTPHDDQ